MKIGINCGHTVSGEVGCGAVGYLNESNETRAVGYKLMELLKSQGHTVVDCTNDHASSVNGNLSAICSMANAQSLDLFVSIHFNAGGGQGTEVYTWQGKEYTAATNVCTKMNALGFKNRGIKDGSGLYVVHHTNAEAMLIETCFVDTQSDASLYNSIGVDRVAAAICEAITGQAVSNGSEVKKVEFNDIQGSFAEEHIKKLAEYGIVNGDGNGHFKPDEPITRAEAAVMIANALTVCGK